MTYEGLLNNNIFLRTRYSSQDVLGNWDYTYSSSTTPTKCRMSPLSARERIEMAGLFDDVKYRCFCLSSSSIDRDSQVEYQNEFYRVREVLVDSSYHHRTALLQLIT